jgi:hypothetical protein
MLGLGARRRSINNSSSNNNNNTSPLRAVRRRCWALECLFLDAYGAIRGVYEQCISDCIHSFYWQFIILIQCITKIQFLSTGVRCVAPLDARRMSTIHLHNPFVLVPLRIAPTAQKLPIVTSRRYTVCISICERESVTDQRCTVCS